MLQDPSQLTPAVMGTRGHCGDGYVLESVLFLQREYFCFAAVIALSHSAALLSVCGMYSTRTRALRVLLSGPVAAPPPAPRSLCPSVSPAMTPMLPSSFPSVLLFCFVFHSLLITCVQNRLHEGVCRRKNVRFLKTPQPAPFKMPFLHRKWDTDLRAGMQFVRH